jgi:type VI secretion system protein ImpJ
MLVLPHHFQAAEAYLTDLLATTHSWLFPNGHGLFDIELNEDALTGYEVRVPRLRARLRDGTLISVPENARLHTVDLKSPMESASTVYLHLVLPELVAGRPNTADSNGRGTTRFLVETQPWDEVHAGDSARTIDVLRYNCEIVVTPDAVPPKNCQSLPIARLKRSLEANSPPEIDPEYIPPLLECQSWRWLQEDILSTISSQLGAYIHSQAEYLRVHGGWTEGNQPQIRKAIRKLDAVNSLYPVFAQLSGTRGTHPRAAYLTLCHLIGELSILREDWKPPPLPLYDHDNLGPIFRKVRDEIQAALAAEGVGAKVQRFPFGNMGQWMEVSLDPQWLQAKYEFYVGVRSDLAAERVEQLFSTRWLDWKLGSSRTINQIYNNAEAGLSIKRVVGVHPSLPVLKDLTYFAVKKTGAYWDQVAESRTLALKVNERYIRRQAVGQSVLTVIDPRNTPRDLALELFVLEND